MNPQIERQRDVDYQDHEIEPFGHESLALRARAKDAIVTAIAAGDRLKATNIYLSATEGSLTEAQNSTKTLTVEAE